MWLAAEMCQHFNINDVLPWTPLLKQMYTLGMVSDSVFVDCSLNQLNFVMKYICLQYSKIVPQSLCYWLCNVEVLLVVINKDILYIKLIK